MSHCIPQAFMITTGDYHNYRVDAKWQGRQPSVNVWKIPQFPFQRHYHLTRSWHLLPQSFKLAFFGMPYSFLVLKILKMMTRLNDKKDYINAIITSVLARTALHKILIKFFFLNWNFFRHFRYIPTHQYPLFSPSHC